MNKSKLKLGIDLTYIREDRASGIKKYAEEIVEGLTKNNNNYKIVLFVDKNLEIIYKEKFSQYKIVAIKEYLRKIKYICNITNLIFSKIHKYKIKSIIKKEKCNVVFYPYVDEFTPITNKNILIGSILDIIPLDIIEDKNSIEYKKMKNKYIKIMNNISNIVTLSEYSKERLLDINPSYNGTIEVIPSSVAKLEKTNKNVSEITNNKYIFSINSFSKHKNQITLLKAFNKIKDQIPHDLILVGRPEFGSPISSYQEVMDYINKENLDDRVKVLSFISDEDRNALFYNTDLFISTSMQEGFGRTPVEAAMCEVPVITTTATSLPEATMNMVYYYKNATNDAELANKILEVLNNKPSKEKLRKIAQTFEKKYDEKVIAKEYIKLIKEILKGEEE